MPIRPWLRSHTAPYALVLMLPLAYFFLRSSLIDLGENWYSATAIAGGVTVVTAPSGAALAAWEANRLQRGGIFTQPDARTLTSVTAWSLWPIVLVCTIVQIAGLLIAWSGMSGVPGTPDVRMIAVTTTVTLGFISLGFMVGRWARPALSVPALLIGGWIALAYPGAIEPFWVRHLTGNLRTCCGTDQVPEPRALIAPAVLALGLIIAFILVALRRRPTPQWTGAATAVVITAFAAAITLVHGMGWEATRPRTSGLVCAPQSGVDVCLWPENESQRSAVAGRLATAALRLHAAGLPAPGQITEGPADGRASWTTMLSRTSTPDDAVVSLITGLLPQPPACADSRPYPGANANAVTGAWLGLHAGLPPSAIQENAGGGNLRIAQRVRKLPRARQLAWFHRNVAAMGTCDLEPARLS